MNGDMGLGLNLYEMLWKKLSVVLFENEVASSAREVATARRCVVEELCVSGLKRDVMKEEREVLMWVEELLVKVERVVCEVECVVKVEAARAAKEAAAVEKVVAVVLCLSVVLFLLFLLLK